MGQTLLAGRFSKRQRSSNVLVSHETIRAHTPVLPILLPDLPTLPQTAQIERVPNLPTRFRQRHLCSRDIPYHGSG